MLWVTAEPRTRARDGPDDDDMTNEYKRDKDRCMKIRSGDERETKFENRNYQDESREIHIKKSGFDRNQIQKLQDLWGWGTQSFYGVDNCGSEHCAILRYLSAN